MAQSGHSPNLLTARFGLSLTGFLCLTAAVLGVTLAANPGTEPKKTEQDPTSQPPSRAALHAPSANKTPMTGDRRLREGSVITDQAGCFKSTGDRIIFSSLDGRITTVCLENLNLERIARAVTDNLDPLEWRVSGTLTEFSGANYLLVERAILKSRTDSRADR